MTAGGDEIVPAHDLAADEAARDVGVDRLRRIDRRLTAPERPRPRLLLAGGEERDQVERLSQPAHDFAESRLAGAAKLGGLVWREVCELRLEVKVDAAVAPVDDLEQRLRRQGIELGRQLALPLRERPSRVEMREQALEIGRLGPETSVSGLRLFRDPLQPALDVIAIGDEQLQLQRL